MVMVDFSLQLHLDFLRKKSEYMKPRGQKASRLQPKLKDKYTSGKLKLVLGCKAGILNDLICKNQNYKEILTMQPINCF